MSQLNSILDKTQKIIDPIIEQVLSLKVDKKYQEIVRYQVFTGGKRLRPALAIISSQLLGGRAKDVLYPAAGLEILHNYTLIIDDIIDNSHLRRNKPTAWAKFGKSIAQCIGVDYSAAVFQAANQSKSANKISEIFAKTIKSVADGEILDILFEQAGREEDLYVVKNRYQSITEKDFIEMIGKKTASLFQACCEIGGICAGAKRRQIEALKNYGYNLGVAFQVSDDILDIFGEEEKFGKKIGKDIEERKGGNIVVYFASREFSPKEKKEFWQILRKKRITQADINRAINLIQKTKAREKAIGYGQDFVKKAEENLKVLPKNKYNTLLKEIANFIIKRER